MMLWTCPNGADEVNCNRMSKCYPDRHECISPIDFEVICLPINRSGDGKIDCLGGTDERPSCLPLPSFKDMNHYRCWNEIKCVIPICSKISNCLFENNTAFYDKCMVSKDIQDILFSTVKDGDLGPASTSTVFSFSKFRYFTLHHSNPMQTSRTEKHIFSDTIETLNTIIDLRRAWTCNRGILVYIDTKNRSHCLCPPAYYGSHCQFQNQRVSLTIKFSKECFTNCFGIYAVVVTLADQNQMIHSYEQFTYLTTENCSTKYNLNLLYGSRPKDESMNYTIEIHAYDKHDLSYFTSWNLPVQFSFLPVNRIATHLVIPAYRSEIINHCPLQCGDHGHCAIFINNGKSFCRCDSGWSGEQCEVQNIGCHCSPDSLCFGIVNKRSICVCSIDKFGPRCFLRSICPNDTCKNGGRCVLEDDQWSLNRYVCICQQGFSGNICEKQDTQIDFSFDHIEIPQSLSIYFVTIQRENDPLISMFSKKIPFDQDKTTLFAPLRFNLIFARIENEYYLVYHAIEASDFPHFSIEIQSSHRCFPIDELLDQRILSFSLLRRAKYYHVACQKRSSLACLYDLDGFMCLCDKERFVNCLHFNFSSKSRCPQRLVCENGGECFPDRPSCPNSMMCVCNKCYFGGKLPRRLFFCDYGAFARRANFAS